MGTSSLVLDEDEAQHCVKVLRHKVGDTIDVIDGAGTMYESEIVSIESKKVTAFIRNVHPQWHTHPYRLTMAVCPTKNNERYEWFIEKAVEIGVDRIVPVIGEHSERKIYKTDRARKIALSATKQSLKAALPEICDPVSVKEFIASADKGLRMIACCFENEDCPRRSLMAVLSSIRDTVPYVTILIGPEGDFSQSEVNQAVDAGYVPVHMGESRLRTETAAVVSVTAVYGVFSEK